MPPPLICKPFGGKVFVILFAFVSPREKQGLARRASNVTQRMNRRKDTQHVQTQVWKVMEARRGGIRLGSQV